MVYIFHSAEFLDLLINHMFTQVMIKSTQINIFFFFFRNKHTHTREREMSSNTKGHHNFTKKPW